VGLLKNRRKQITVCAYLIFSPYSFLRQRTEKPACFLTNVTPGFSELLYNVEPTGNPSGPSVIISKFNSTIEMALEKFSYKIFPELNLTFKTFSALEEAIKWVELPVSETDKIDNAIQELKKL
jgi:hypothetical protein